VYEAWLPGADEPDTAERHRLAAASLVMTHDPRRAVACPENTFPDYKIREGTPERSAQKNPFEAISPTTLRNRLTTEHDGPASNAAR
jgi:hypothetical protein